MNELINSDIISSLILKGDISGLNPTQKVQHVMNLCQRLGLDPLTQPFKILKLQGKEVLYADKGCTQQLCKIYGISTEITKKEKIEDVYVVTIRASNKEGRFTDDDGAVTINNQARGDVLANALMKCVTKAKRRAVLAFCGLGMLDESETETIKGAVITDPIVIKSPDSPRLVDEINKHVFTVTPDMKAVGAKEIPIEASLQPPLPVVTHEHQKVDTSDLEDIAIRVFKGKKSGMKNWLKEKFQATDLSELKEYSREVAKGMLLDMELWQNDGIEMTKKGI